MTDIELARRKREEREETERNERRETSFIMRPAPRGLEAWLPTARDLDGSVQVFFHGFGFEPLLYDHRGNPLIKGDE